MIHEIIKLDFVFRVLMVALNLSIGVINVKKVSKDGEIKSNLEHLVFCISSSLSSLAKCILVKIIIYNFNY